MKVDPKRPVPPHRESVPVRPTPGPWGLEYDGSVVIGGQIAISPDSCGPDDIGRDERKANCRLIAAAPDMLEVLCTIADAGLICPMPIGAPGSAARHVWQEQRALMERARAVIRQATGGVA